MSVTSFQILKYSTEHLAKALSTKFFSKEHILSSKFHYKFLIEYLGDKNEDALGAKTILIESDYLSRDYLYDYANYYALCFSDEYLKKTKRIHFFKSEFTDSEFLKEYSSDTTNFITDESYLGYIVVKPLPNVLIGKTILKTYPFKNEKYSRTYTRRLYNVHLFGRKLSIKSIAFQEQDRAVSACATCALWASFQKTAELFQTKLPIPYEITNAAKNLFLNSGRNFPNSGLDEYQIGNAINNVGLVFELRNSDLYLSDKKQCKAFIYSYLKMGIPVLLGIEIENIGYHLITILGFKEKLVQPKTRKLKLKAQQLEMFYAHDDQVGPYSRLEFKNNSGNKYLETSWWKDDKGNIKRKAKIESIFVPLYDKIRISFDDVHKSIKYINLYLNKVIIEGNVIWDIFLEKSNFYKESVLKDKSVDSRIKQKVIFKSLPKYIWIAEAYVNNTKIVEFIYDSTDMARGLYCIGFNCFSLNLKERIKSEELENQDFKEFLTQGLHPNFFDILFSEVNSE